MMLSDRAITFRMSDNLKIEPFPDAAALQPASLDVRLGGVASAGNLDYDGNEFWKIVPGEFVLGTTLERVEIPDDLAVRIEGKSSWGRLGLAVHITAGFIDPGFKGQITLELKNLGNDVLRLCHGDYIAQLSFHQLSSPAMRPYGTPSLNSHYQNQEGVTQSWL